MTFLEPFADDSETDSRSGASTSRVGGMKESIVSSSVCPRNHPSDSRVGGATRLSPVSPTAIVHRSFDTSRKPQRTMNCSISCRMWANRDSDRPASPNVSSFVTTTAICSMPRLMASCTCSRV